MQNSSPTAAAVAAGLTRRGLIAALPLALAACSGTRSLPDFGGMFGDESEYSSIYGPLPNEPHPVPALRWRSLEPVVLRREVADPTGEEPGAIVVDPQAKHLYLVQDGGRAIRYGIGVGREGFEWSGKATVARKAEWPTWTPTPDMIKRDPKLNKPWAGGMPGGLDNPLGARALYLYQGGRDSSYRIHGTNNPRSIGKAMSSGCIRMFNHDVIDLYRRAPVGSKVQIRA
jgi:lipoprotein-anchoring transpeptidase ErfK/SrfK